MEGARRCRSAGEIGGSIAAVLLALVAAAVLLVPGAALALHNPSAAGQDGSVCSHCHNLSAGAGATEANTSMIISSGRTLTSMKAANGGTVPVTFGCTYCHNNAANTVMKGVLNHFRDDRSRHPIGERFVGFASTAVRPDTGNEYLSNRTGLTGAADELECLDCHQQSLVDDTTNANYVDHVAPGTGGRVGNPYMLKSVTADGQYDVFCRTCHGAGAPATFTGTGKAGSGIAIKLVSHKDGSNSTTNAMTEMDGTVLKTADLNGDGTADPTVPTTQCTQCHGGHTSTQVKLFSAAVGNGLDCTTLCHYAGDYFGNYTRHGHGKAVSTYKYGGITMDMDMSCTNCHVPLDTTTADRAVRKKHAPKTAIPVGGDRAIYKANFSLTGNVNSTDPGTASGNPAWGICINCHSLTAYKDHVSYEGAPTGCQDCHDEHAEGSGITSNVFMIPEKSKKGGFFKQPTGTPRAGLETITYAKARFLADGVTTAGTPYDFFRADGAGVCDNTECHGTTNSASQPGPLSALMTASRHSGGDKPAGNDCEGCHTHKDPQGGWGASAACDICHADFERVHAGSTQSKPTHDRHIAAASYVTGCTACHPHNGSTVSYGTPPHGDGTVTFGGPQMSTAFNYSGVGAFSDANCSALANGCHDADAGEWAANTLGTDACVDCHRSGTKLLGNGKAPTSGLHAMTASNVQKHDETLAAGNCVNCHQTTVAAPPSHIDGSWEADNANNAQSRFVVRTGMTYSEAAANTATCSGTGGLTGCHRDNGNWSRLWSTTANVDYITNPNPGQAVCNVCHGVYSTIPNSTGWRAGTSHYRAGQADHIGDLATENKGINHADPSPLSCEDCHAYPSGTDGLHDSDNKINFSDGAPTSYNTTYAVTPNRWYCLDCHVLKAGESPIGTGTHTFPDSLAFPGMANKTHTNGSWEPSGSSLGCTACHGNDSAGAPWNNRNIWPAAGTGYPKRGGEHAVHITKLAEKLGLTTVISNGTITDAEQQRMCAFCHVYTTFPGETGHDGVEGEPADLAAGSFNPLWSTLDGNSLPNVADADGVYTDTAGAVDGACSLVDCHDNKTTSTAYDWYDNSATACVMCHSNVMDVLDLSHTAHVSVATGTNFGYQVACGDCHGSAIVWGAPGTAPTANHINGSFTVGSTTVRGGAYTVTYTGFNYYTGVKGTCGTNICHTRGYSTAGPILAAPYNVNGAASYTWGTAYVPCTLCHGDASTTAAFNAVGGLGATTTHAAHLNGSATFGRNIVCVDCHAAGTATTHLNGTVNLPGTVTFTYAGGDTPVTGTTYGTCGASLCHNDGTGIAVAPKVDPRWDAGPQPNCTICHNDGTNDGTLAHAIPITGRHPAHPLTSSYVADTCDDCHTAASTTSHLNGVKNLAPAVISAYTATGAGQCTNTCHNVVTARATAGAPYPRNGGWLNAIGLACADCHKPGTTYIGRADHPSWTSPSSGHTTHLPVVTDKSVAADSVPYCGVCHSDWANYTTLHPASTTHINGTWNTAWKAVGAPGANTQLLFDTGHTDLAGSTIAQTWNATTQGLSTCSGYKTGGDPTGGCHGAYTGHAGDTSDTYKWNPHGTNISWLSDCTGCHSSAQAVTNAPLIGYRRAVVGAGNDFALATHHVTGTPTAADCVKCHFEGATTGSTGASDRHRNGTVELRIWNGTYETTIPPDSAFNAAGSANCEVYTTTDAPSTLTAFCEGCHDAGTSGTTIFAGDTPKIKAWDGVDIKTKFESVATGAFSPYSSATYNVTPAAFVTKAKSPHYRPDLNKRDIATLGNTWADTGGNATGLACTDCHNTHGSNTTVNRKWTAKTGTIATPVAAELTGGLLIGLAGRPRGDSTYTYDTAGTGKATVGYTPTASATAKSFSAEADLCFDCHVGNDAAPNTSRTYTTYGVAEQINDYYSGLSGRWKVGTDTWDTRSFTYKKGTSNPAIASSHWNGSTSGVATYTILDGSNKGQCTPCHDPHGVTTATTATATEARNVLQTTNGGLKFPLLKGNWLTSPYKEDRAGDFTTSTSTLEYDPDGTGTEAISPGPVPRAHPNLPYNNPPIVGGGYGGGITGSGTYGIPGATSGHDGYFIDDNTWGTTGAAGYIEYWRLGGTPGNADTGPRPNYPTSGPMNGTYEDFAGICAVCHAATAVKPATGAIQSLRSVHNTVKGIQETINVANVFVGATSEGLAPATKMYSGTTDAAGRGSKGTGQYRHGANGNGSYAGAKSQLFPVGSGYKSISVSAGINAHAGWGWGFNHNNNAPVNLTSYYLTGGLYHRFSCSKCHAPHSEALPRLMRTNCLSTTLNKEPKRWQASGATGTQTYSGGGGTGGWDDTNSNSCHGEDYSPSWNAVTPWAPTGAGNTNPNGGWIRNGRQGIWPTTN